MVVFYSNIEKLELILHVFCQNASSCLTMHNGIEWQDVYWSEVLKIFGSYHACTGICPQIDLLAFVCTILEGIWKEKVLVKDTDRNIWMEIYQSILEGPLNFRSFMRPNK